MSAPALAGRPVVTIRGRGYPVLLPTVRDPRLHLAFVIVTLQVLGQTVFGFSLSIAQILVSLGTCAVLEIGIAFFRQGILMWPASALLTGNGVAFILRVPGTQHGDWWSMHGWWIFASTAAVSILSKHVIRYQGRHLFNPSNFGLVLCFLALGKARAEPLDFWWGPMSVWMALALALIVVGGLTILSRLKLLFVAVGFWVAFAAGIGVLAASGHSMTARWHLGPITGWSFWWLLVTSPEILIFLFFMITDPMTIPRGRPARWVYAVGVGLLATLLIAPQTTERASKIAVLGALFLFCAARPLVERLVPEGDTRPALWARVVGERGRIATVGLSVAFATAFAGIVVLAGVPARPETASAEALPAGQALPQVSVSATQGVSASVDQATARSIAQDIVVDLRSDGDALRLRDPARAAAGAGGAFLVDLRRQIGGAAGGAIAVPSYDIEHVALTLERGTGQGPPRILAKVTGLEQIAVYTGQPPMLDRRQPAKPFARTMEVALQQGHYVIVDASGAATPAITSPTPPAEVVGATGPLAGVHLQDVASQVGLHFRQGSFRFGVSDDVQAMMGGGVCWLDYDNDGWLDLFVVNSYSEADTDRWATHGGLPRTALFHNVRGSFVNVSKRSGADLPIRGDGCVAADFNGDGYTDLYVTTTSYDELLWNNGNGTFTEGAKAAGIAAFGWHSGAAVADVNGDGRPDLFVAGYTDLNTPNATAIGGFPTSYAGVRDLLYLNEGNDSRGHARFREVGVQAGLEAADFSHGLGAIFTDYDGDGRPDLYVANDEDPNQLYENVAWPGGAAADPAGLGFRFEERGAAEGVADPFAGMGIASGDYDGDGKLDLFVTNSRREPYAVLRHATTTDEGAPAFDNGRPAFRSAAAGSAGWGASWVDLSLDGTPDLVLANGDIPVTSLSKDAARVQVLAPGSSGRYANVAVPGLAATPDVNGRGLAAADYDNNGTVDIAVNSIGGRLVLLRNTGEKGHWLEVRLSRFAPGAVATAVLPDGRTLVDEEHAGSSYLSSEDPRLHFGLGNATQVRSLVVRFPGGGQTRLSNVGADRVVVVNPPAARSVPPRPTASYARSDCTSLATPTRSVARIWNDALLADDPGKDDPAEEARDLFHLSAAMWDAWDAYSPKGTGYFLTEKHRADGDALAARNAAISYAAYRLLLWRASYGANVQQAFAHLTDTMRLLCYEPGFTSTKGDSPAALGNRIAAAAIAYGKTDGSLETRHYLDPSFVPANEPMVVSQPGTPMHDATFWQPLAFGQIRIQGGFPIPADVQSFVDSQWGHVRGFALPASRRGLPIDPGAPDLGDPSGAAYKRAAIDVIRTSARAGGATVVARWLGGQGAPARWNEIADSASDARDRGSSAAARLVSDVKLSFALNGALHDAAIAIWGAKRTYDSVRPISMIRTLAFAGQSSDRKAPSYSADGIPLVPGLVELVTKESSAPGQRHAALAGHVGDVAGPTATGWVLGTRWTPRAGVTTPPSPGWVSDGAAFGHAAAAVLAAYSGNAKVPPAASLRPWKTYAGAASDAALAGVDAGTDTTAGASAGTRLGATVGTKAWTLAQRYFTGTVR
jgi:hypothetical protein